MLYVTSFRNSDTYDADAILMRAWCWDNIGVGGSWRPATDWPPDYLWDTTLYPITTEWRFLRKEDMVWFNLVWM